MVSIPIPTLAGYSEDIKKLPSETQEQYATRFHNKSLNVHKDALTKLKALLTSNNYQNFMTSKHAIFEEASKYRQILHTDNKELRTQRAKEIGSSFSNLKKFYDTEIRQKTIALNNQTHDESTSLFNAFKNVIAEKRKLLLTLFSYKQNKNPPNILKSAQNLYSAITRPHIVLSKSGKTYSMPIDSGQRTEIANINNEAEQAIVYIQDKAKNFAYEQELKKARAQNPTVKMSRGVKITQEVPEEKKLFTIENLSIIGGGILAAIIALKG